jgi:shikimate kinase
MTDPKPNLILIGLRASGKSTLGARLAESLGVGFVDLDNVTARLLEADGAGAAIEAHGIEAFRGAEKRALKSVLAETGRVIALGGGTPTAPGCSEMLSEDPCRVIYLRALVETLQERLKGEDNSDRPALVGSDVVDEVQALFDQRDKLYRSIAESVIHTDGVSEESVMSALISVAKAGF